MISIRIPSPHCCTFFLLLAGSLSGCVSSDNDPVADAKSDQQIEKPGFSETKEFAVTTETSTRVALSERSGSAAIRIVDNNVSGGGFQSDVTITDDGRTVFRCI